MLQTSIQIVSEDNFNKIHASALRVMSKVGARVEHERTRNALEALGCTVNNDIVLFPEKVVESFIASMKELGKQKEVNLNPDRPRIVPHVTGQAMLAHDLTTDELLPATRQDLVNATRVANALPGVVIGHPSYIPQDVHPMVRDIHTLEIVARYFPTSREVEVFSEQTIDVFIDIADVIRGNRQKVIENPPFSYRAYGASPFIFGNDGLNILWKLIEKGVKDGLYVGHVMPVLGISTPITLSAYLISLIAEGLEAAIVHKAITGKTRFFLGGPCTIDMSTLTSSQSSPESALLNLASMEISRYYGDPEPFYPYALSTDSKFPDVQAGFEKAYKIMLATAGGSREIVTGVGVLSQASVVSVGQMVIDYDFCMLVNRLLQGIDFAEPKLAEQLIIDLGIGANFIAEIHTAKHFREELFLSDIFDRRALGAWQEDRQSMLEHAKAKVSSILEEEPQEYLNTDQVREIEKIVKAAEQVLT